MGYKTLRNRALKGQRIITGDYYGDTWSCTDAFATEFDIFKDYKTNKYNQVMPGRPLLDKIIERDGHYVDATALEVPETNTTELLNGVTKVLINTDYIRLMQALYPGAILAIDTAYSYSPVRVVKNNKLVGVIMPLKD